ncbi:cobalt-zinc-cadmium efflux system protein [Salinimicrobium catena]|uniref:Cobalt-zinc-cadmium efflux system protein n=1 Tax=Salinimicrobium catena TaxID=390640 RepID=A0A1H5M7H1_9FLAO|nr:cation diffusion facilitator family transporter [Salinimicrobium catena]SDL18566.1 cobalt-zinc-cadmium efflux system protein [Salinimicrobium catena]SEE84318.1 cobalt-zinc-cadmium efflux system protein [Salinimicrobium catena]
MGHDHDHHSAGKNLKFAFFLNAAFTIFELIGGFYVNSVAIISDAVHDLGDTLSLGTSWYLQNKSQQKRDSKFSFGYKRFSLLGALINSLVLLGGSIFVITEAVNRLIEPERSDAEGMMIFAIVGVAVNGIAAYKLSSGESLNEKVVSWHLLEDVLGWVAVLIVAIILQFKEILYLDPALSLLITFYILWNVFKRLKETLFIFLQGVPKEIDLDEIEERLKKIPNISSLHHMHVWSLEGTDHVFTTHIKLKNINRFQQLLDVKRQVKNVLQEYHFDHYTIETELDEETCDLL